MNYKEWFDAHAKKHRKIVEKLIAKGFTQEQIIDYFDYENMAKEESEFCPLYKEGKKCHNMQELNCYLCACPNFRFNDNGLGTYNDMKILSRCDIHNGSSIGRGGTIHQDCSKCSVPHHKSYIQKNFDLQWEKVMQKCLLPKSL